MPARETEMPRSSTLSLMHWSSLCFSRILDAFAGRTDWLTESIVLVDGNGVGENVGGPAAPKMRGHCVDEAHEAARRAACLAFVATRHQGWLKCTFRR